MKEDYIEYLKSLPMPWGEISHHLEVAEFFEEASPEWKVAMLHEGM